LQRFSLVLAAAAFLLALAPRLHGLDVFVTTDELFWAGRTGSFSRALSTGRLAETFQTGHPGVTTMWAGLAGMGFDRALRLAGERREVSRRQIAASPDFLPGLEAGRQVVAISTAAAIAICTLLAARLLGSGAALAGGALLALDPFLLAHSQLLHLDALEASFMAIALLAGLVRWLAGGGRGYLIVSAVATGLALLSKSPALFLFGFLPLVALTHALARRESLSDRLRDLLGWAGLVLTTYVVAWPALWVAPVDTLRGVFEFARGNAATERATVALDPLFYLWTVALRSTPLQLFGLGVLLFAGLAYLTPSALRSSSGLRVTSALWLLAFALLFGLAMTLAAKSFDRYLLPAFPALDLLAGLGLALAAGRLRWIGGAGALLAGAFALPVLAYPTLTSLPYAIDWYNPLFGGGPVAQRTIGVGWGEGLDQVARQLNRLPDPGRVRVSLPGEIYTTVLDAQLAGQVAPAEGGDPTSGDASHFVWYVKAADQPPVYDPRFQLWPPLQTVRIADVDFARVYDATSGIPLGAHFANQLRADGYTLDQVALRAGRPVTARLLLSAEPSQPPAIPVLVLTDLAGQQVARASPGGAEPTSGRPRWRSLSLSLPAELQPAEYLLWLSAETVAGQPIPLAERPASLAAGAPEHPQRAILRSIQVVAR
jgi:hypothetical protein